MYGKLRKVDCPIAVGWCDTSEFAPLGMFLKLLESGSWHVESGDVYLAEDIFAKFEWFGHSEVDLYEAGVDKGSVIYVLHAGGHIHLLHDGAVEGSLAYAL